FLELLKYLTDGQQIPGQIVGTAWMSDGEVQRTPDRHLIADLDQLPFPAWDLFNLDCYNENIHISNVPAMPIMGSRGCPFECSFCASPHFWRRQTRFRSPENVVAEMVENQMCYGITHFHFYDDNFLLRPDWVAELCSRIRHQRLAHQWICLSRAAAINRNTSLLPTMREAGCCGFEIGVESGDERVLESTHKAQQLDEIPNALMQIAMAGFLYLGIQLMTFNEGETVNGHYRQSQFLAALFQSLRPFDIRLSAESQFPFLGQFATPYPGTSFQHSAPLTGMVLAKHWSDYVTTRVNYIPTTLLNCSTRLTQSLDASALVVLDRVSRQRVFGCRSKDLEHLGQLPEMFKTFESLQKDGTTITTLARALSSFYGITEDLAFRFAAVNLVTASQMGIVRSTETRSGLE
ncbi:partial 2-hydroxyethylphosphonate methyltransferase, partial [Candidatus Brocadiaceae bacterium]